MGALPAVQIQRGPGQVLERSPSPALAAEAARERALAAHGGGLQRGSELPDPALPQLAACSGDEAFAISVPCFAGAVGMTEVRGSLTPVYVVLWDPWVKVLINVF